MIDALRNRYRLKTLLSVLQMSKSSYFYQEAAMAAPDKYADVREKIRQAFDESSNRYGYRRIHAALRNESVTVSEKVVCRLMKQDRLTVKSVRKRKYNSYKGEITPRGPERDKARFPCGCAESEMADGHHGILHPGWKGVSVSDY